MTNERFQSYLFDYEKMAKNRVVIPPMASQTADENGFVTEKTIDHYTRLAQAQAGIIFVEYSFIHSSGKGEFHQLGVNDDRQITGLQKISEVIRSSGALSGLQIVHVGGKSKHEITGQSLIAPSAVKVPVQGWDPDIPLEASASQIKDLIEWYIQSARRVQKAGFDFVELHAAHGYGLNQWLSPLTNQRQDEYGKNLIGRSRLLLQIVQQIKSELPGLLISIRLPGQDHLEGGLTSEDMIWITTSLEKLGVDLINVSSGLGGWRRRDQRTHQGYLVADAAVLKKHLHIPVIGVGGIESGEFIDQILQTSQVDFAAVGRAILKDPKTWGDTELSVCCEQHCQASSF